MFIICAQSDTAFSETFRIFIVFFSGLAIYNACEIIATALFYFKHYRGLYFWSLLIAAWGIIPYSALFMMKFMNIITSSKWVTGLAVITNICECNDSERHPQQGSSMAAFECRRGLTLCITAWYAMVTGQAVVLWSRLHLVVSGKRGDRILRLTKYMIITNVLILHLPTTVLSFGAQGTLQTQTFAYGYNIIEKVYLYDARREAVADISQDTNGRFLSPGDDSIFHLHHRNGSSAPHLCER